MPVSRQPRCPPAVTLVLQTVMVILGLGFVSGSIAVGWIAGANRGFGTGQTAMACFGVFLVFYGLVLRFLGQILIKLALTITVVTFLLCGLEAFCHVIAFDFNATTSAWNATPIYFRQPTQVAGDIYFQRKGDRSWRGRIMTTWLKHQRIREVNAYSDEPIVTITYDEHGFRNPEGLKDWRIVFIGDSFTELGHIPYDDLFTTIVGKRLGVCVKNLGVASTGTRTHIFYLNEYGKSSSCTDAVLVFFEGNDVGDIRKEVEAYETFEKTGERPVRDLTASRQTSLVVALSLAVQARLKPLEASVNATVTLNGQQIDNTVYILPPEPKEMSTEEVQRVMDALRDWADAANSLGIRPWLVYMPCKRRVLHGHIQFHEGVREDLLNWEPNQLPELIQQLCERFDIQFVDMTPTLVAQTEHGVLTYNHVYDTHLNRNGSHAVGEAIAEVFEDVINHGELRDLHPASCDGCLHASPAPTLHNVELKDWRPVYPQCAVSTLHVR